MLTFFTKRLEVPEIWFDALLLAFKLPVVILPVWLLVWCALLGPSEAQSYSHDLSYFAGGFWTAADDYRMVASSLPGLFFGCRGVNLWRNDSTVKILALVGRV